MIERVLNAQERLAELRTYTLWHISSRQSKRLRFDDLAESLDVARTWDGKTGSLGMFSAAFFNVVLENWDTVSIDPIPLSKVLDELNKLGLPIGKATLRNYWKAGLCAQPIKSGGGRGLESLFPRDMAATAFASSRLLEKGIPTTTAADAVWLALWISLQTILIPWNTYTKVFMKAGFHFAKLSRSDFLPKLIHGLDFETFLAMQWVSDKFDAQERLAIGAPPGLEETIARRRVIKKIFLYLIEKSLDEKQRKVEENVE